MAGCNFLPNVSATTSSCCDRHDDDYRLGKGTRLEADQRLRDCVLKGGSKRWKVTLAYWGVRLFGWAWWYACAYIRWRDKND